MISVYKRHTPFSIVINKINIQGNNINIPKKGDLLSYVYFTRTNKTTQLMENWDSSVINDVSIYIGDRFVDKQDPYFTQTVAPSLIARTFSKSGMSFNTSFYPLQFFFCNDIPFPLISLQKDDLRIVLDWSPSNQYYYECYLCYIYLGDEEREWFAKTNVTVDIYQVTKLSSATDIVARNPVKFIASEPIKLPSNFQYSIKLNGQTTRERYNSYGAQLTYHTDYAKITPLSQDTFPPTAMSTDSETLISPSVIGVYSAKASSNTSTNRPFRAFDKNISTSWTSGGQSALNVPVTYTASASSNTVNAFNAFDNQNTTHWISDVTTYDGFDPNLSGAYIINASSNVSNAFLVYDSSASTRWISDPLYGNTSSVGGTYIASASSGAGTEASAFDLNTTTQWASTSGLYYMDVQGQYIMNVSSINSASSSITAAFDNDLNTQFESNNTIIYGTSAPSGQYTASAGTIESAQPFNAFDNPINSTSFQTLPSYGSNVFISASFNSRASSNNGSTTEFRAFNSDSLVWSSNVGNATYGVSTFAGTYSSDASTNATNSWRPSASLLWQSSTSFGNSIPNGTYSISSTNNTGEAWRVSGSGTWTSDSTSNGFGASSLNGQYSCSASSNNNVQAFRALDGDQNTFWESQPSTSRLYGTFFTAGESYASNSTTNIDSSLLAFTTASDSWYSDTTSNVYTKIKKPYGEVVTSASSSTDVSSNTLWTEPDDGTAWVSTDQVPSYGNALPVGTYKIDSCSGNSFYNIFTYNDNPSSKTSFCSSTNIDQLTASGNTASDFTFIYAAGNVMTSTSVGQITNASIPWQYYSGDAGTLQIAPKKYLSGFKFFEQYNESDTVNKSTSKSISFLSADYFGVANVGTYFATASSNSTDGSFAYRVFDNSTFDSWKSIDRYTPETGLPSAGAPTTTLTGAVTVTGDWVQLEANSNMIFDQIDTVTPAVAFRIVGSTTGASGSWVELFRKQSGQVVGTTVIPSSSTLYSYKFLRLIVEQSESVPGLTGALDGGFQDENSERQCDDLFFDLRNKSTNILYVTSFEPLFGNYKYRPASGSVCSFWYIRGASYAAASNTVGDTTVITSGATRNQNVKNRWSFYQVWTGIQTVMARQTLTLDSPLIIQPGECVACYLFAGYDTSAAGTDGRGFPNGQHNLFRRDDETLDLPPYNLDGTEESNLAFYKVDMNSDASVNYSSARSPATQWGVGQTGAAYGTNRISAIITAYYQNPTYRPYSEVNFLTSFFKGNTTHPVNGWTVSQTSSRLVNAPTDVNSSGGFFAGNLTTGRRIPVTAGVRGPWIEFDFGSGISNCVNLFSINFVNNRVANNIVVYGASTFNDLGSAGYTLVNNFNISSAIQNGSLYTFTGSYTTRYRLWRFVFANTVVNQNATSIEFNDMKLYENNGFGFLHPEPSDGGPYIGTEVTGTVRGEWFSFNYSPGWEATRLRLKTPDSIKHPLQWALMGSTTWDNPSGATGWTQINVPGIPSTLARNTDYISEPFAGTAYKSYRFVVISTPASGVTEADGGSVAMQGIELLNSSNIYHPTLFNRSNITLVTEIVTMRYFTNTYFINEAISAGSNDKLQKFVSVVPSYTSVGAVTFSDYNASLNWRVPSGVKGSFSLIGTIKVQLSGTYSFRLQARKRSNLYINNSITWWSQSSNITISGSIGNESRTVSINLVGGTSYPFVIIGESDFNDQNGVIFEISQEVNSYGALNYNGFLGNGTLGGPYQGTALTPIGSPTVQTPGLWYDITFPSTRTIRYYNITFPYAFGLKSWRILTSTDGTNFTSVDSKTIDDRYDTTGDYNNLITLASDASCIKVRLLITASQPFFTNRFPDAVNINIKNLIFLDPNGRPVHPSFNNYSEGLGSVQYLGSFSRGPFSTSTPTAFNNIGLSINQFNNGIYTGTDQITVGASVLSGYIIKINLPYSSTVSRYSFVPNVGDNSLTPSRFTLAGSSSDNGPWTLVDSRTSANYTGTINQPTTLVCQSPSAYKVYALVIERVNGGNSTNIQNIRFFGATGSIIPNGGVLDGVNYNLTRQNDNDETRLAMLGGIYEGPYSTVVSGSTIRGEWIQHRFPTSQGIGISNVIGYTINTITSRLAGWVMAYTTDTGASPTWTLMDRQSNNYINTTSRTFTVSEIPNIISIRLIPTEVYGQGQLDISSIGLIFRDGSYVRSSTIDLQSAAISTNTFRCFTSNAISGFTFQDTSVSPNFRFNPGESIFTSNLTYSANPPRYIGTTPDTGIYKGEFIDVDLQELRQVTKFSFRTNPRRYNGLYYQVFVNTLNGGNGPASFDEVRSLFPVQDGYTTNISSLNLGQNTRRVILHAWGFFRVQEAGEYRFTSNCVNSSCRSNVWIGANALSPTFANSTFGTTAASTSTLFTTASLTKDTWQAFRFLGWTTATFTDNPFNLQFLSSLTVNTHNFEGIARNLDGWMYPQQNLSQYSGEAANNFVLLGSTDGQNFDVNLHISNNTTPYFTSSFVPRYDNVYTILTTSTTPVRRVRFVVSNTVNSNVLSVSNFTLYGTDGRLIPYGSDVNNLTPVRIGGFKGETRFDSKLGEAVQFRFSLPTTCSQYSIKSDNFPASWNIYGIPSSTKTITATNPLTNEITLNNTTSLYAGGRISGFSSNFGHVRTTDIYTINSINGNNIQVTPSLTPYGEFIDLDRMTISSINASTNEITLTSSDLVQIGMAIRFYTIAGGWNIDPNTFYRIISKSGNIIKISDNPIETELDITAGSSASSRIQLQNIIYSPFGKRFAVIQTNAGSNTITLNSVSGLTVGDQIRILSSYTPEIDINTLYYITSIVGNDVTLSTNFAGPTLDFTQQNVFTSITSTILNGITLTGFNSLTNQLTLSTTTNLKIGDQIKIDFPGLPSIYNITNIAGTSVSLANSDGTNININPIHSSSTTVSIVSVAGARYAVTAYDGLTDEITLLLTTNLSIGDKIKFATTIPGLNTTTDYSIISLDTSTNKIKVSMITGEQIPINSTATQAIGTTVTKYSYPVESTAGLAFRIYGGYFNDNVNWFALQGITSEYGTSSDFTNINTATSNIVASNSSREVYSVEWFGKFTPDQTGTWTFYLASDDASYVWIGPSAVTGYTTGNALIKLPGLHGEYEESNTISLVSGTEYAIRIQFGENFFGDNLVFSFTRPGSSTRVYNSSLYTNYGSSGFAVNSIDVINNRLNLQSITNLAINDRITCHTISSITRIDNAISYFIRNPATGAIGVALTSESAAIDIINGFGSPTTIYSTSQVGTGFSLTHINRSTNTFTVFSGTNLSNGDQIRFNTINSNWQIDQNQNYFIKNLSGSSFEISVNAGGPSVQPADYDIFRMSTTCTISSAVGAKYAVTAFSAANDTLTLFSTTNLSYNDQIRFSTVMGNLDNTTFYYIVFIDGLTIKVSTTPNGAPIDLTGTATTSATTVIAYGFATDSVLASTDDVSFVSAVNLALGDRIQFTGGNPGYWGIDTNINYFVQANPVGKLVKLSLTSGGAVYNIGSAASTTLVVENTISGGTITANVDSTPFTTIHQVSNYYVATNSTTERTFNISSPGSYLSYGIQVIELQPSQSTVPAATFNKINFFDQNGILLNIPNLPLNPYTLQNNELKGTGIIGKYEISSSTGVSPLNCFNFADSNFEFALKDTYENVDATKLGFYRGSSITSNVVGYTYPSVIGNWIQIKVPLPVYTRSFSYTVPNIDAAPKDITILGSNDAVSWTTLFTSTDVYAPDGPSTQLTYQLNNTLLTGSWSTYRIVVSNLVSTYTSTVTNPGIIGKINLDNTDSFRINSFLNDTDISVPNTYGGRYIGTESISGEFGEWIEIDFPYSTISNVIAVRPRSLNLYPSNIAIYGSTTGSPPFTLIQKGPPINLFGSDTKYIRFTNATAYRSYVIQILSTMENITTSTTSASTFTLCNEKSVPLTPYLISDSSTYYQSRPYTTCPVSAAYKYYPSGASVGFNPDLGKHYSTKLSSFSVTTGLPLQGISNVITIKFPIATRIQMYTVKNPNLNSWSLQGSNDNILFTPVHSITNVYVSNALPSNNVFVCYATSPGLYKFYRFSMDRAIIGSTAASIGGIELYDRQGKVNPPINQDSVEYITAESLIQAGIGINGGNVLSTNEFILTFNLPTTESINSYSIASSTAQFLRSWQLTTGAGTVLHTVNDFMRPTNNRAVSFFIPTNAASRTNSFRLIINATQSSTTSSVNISDFAFYTQQGFRVMPIDFSSPSRVVTNSPSTSPECLGEYTCDSSWNLQNVFTCFNGNGDPNATSNTFSGTQVSNGWSVYTWYNTSVSVVSDAINLITNVPPDYSVSNVLITDNLIRMPTGVSGNHVYLLEANLAVASSAIWDFTFAGNGTRQMVWFDVNAQMSPNINSTTATSSISVNVISPRQTIRWLISKNSVTNTSFSFTRAGVINYQLGPSITQNGTSLIAGEWIEIQFPGSVQLRSYSLGGSTNLTAWTLYGTNNDDRTSWTTVNTVSTVTTTDFNILSVNDPLKIYRLVVNSSSSTPIQFGTFKFRGLNGRLNPIITSNFQNVTTNTLFGGIYNASTPVQTNVDGSLISGEFLEYTLTKAIACNVYSVVGTPTDWLFVAFDTGNNRWSNINQQVNQVTKASYYRATSSLSSTRYRLIMLQTSGESATSTADVSSWILFDMFGQRIIPILSTASSAHYNPLMLGQLVGEVYTTRSSSASTIGSNTLSNWTSVSGLYNSFGAYTGSSSITVGGTPISGEWFRENYETSVIPTYYSIDASVTNSTNAWTLLGWTGSSWTTLDTRSNQPSSNVSFSINSAGTPFVGLAIVSRTTRGTPVSVVRNLTIFDRNSNIISNVGSTTCGGQLVARDVYQTTVSGQTINAEWIECQYASPVFANSAIITYNSAQSASNLYIAGWTGTLWNLVGSVSNTTSYIATNQQVIPFSTNIGAYSRFRFLFISMVGTNKVDVQRIQIFNNSGKLLIPTTVNSNDQINAQVMSVESSIQTVTTSGILPPNSLGAFYAASTGTYIRNPPVNTTFFDLFTRQNFSLDGEFYSINFNSPTNMIRFAFRPSLPTSSSWAIVGSNDNFITGNVLYNVTNAFTPANIPSTWIANTTNSFPYSQYRIVVNRACTNLLIDTGVSWVNPVFISSSGISYAPSLAVTNGTFYSNTVTTTGGVNGDFIQIQLPAPRIANVYSFSMNGVVPISWYLYGANTLAGGTFQQLATSQNNYYSTSTSFSSVFTNQTHLGYDRYRLVFTELFGNKIDIRNFTLTTNDGVRIYPYLTQNIQTFTGAQSLIPTSLEGSYTYAVSSAQDTERSMRYLFDLNNDTVWTSAGATYSAGNYTGINSQAYSSVGVTQTPYMGEWVDITFPQPTQITRFGFITSKIPSMTPNVFILLGSLDGTTFTNVISANAIGGQYSVYPTKNQSNIFPSSNTFAFSRVKFIVSTVINNDRVSLTDFSVYSNNGRIIPKLTITSADNSITRDTTINTNEIQPIFGGSYRGTKFSNIHSAPSGVSPGGLQGSFLGEWIQLGFPLPIASMGDVKFLRITGDNLIANAIVLVSNISTGSGLGFSVPQTNTGQASQAIWTTISNNYLSSTTFTIPLPTVPTLSIINNGTAFADIMRIVVQETGPTTSEISTLRCRSIEILDSKQRSILTVLAGSTTNNITDPSSGEVIGGRITTSSFSRFGGTYRGAAITGTTGGEWIQIQFPSPVFSNGYSVEWGTPSPIGWAVFASTNGSTWVPLDTRGRIKNSEVSNYVYNYLTTPSTSYQYYRLVITEYGGSSTSISSTVRQFSILNSNNDILNRVFTGSSTTQDLTNTGQIFSSGRYRGVSNLVSGINGEWITLQLPTKTTQATNVTLSFSDTNTDISQWSIYTSNDGTTWSLSNTVSNTFQSGTFSSNVVPGAYGINNNDFASPCGPIEVILSTQTNASGTYVGPAVTSTTNPVVNYTAAWAQLEYFKPLTLTTLLFTNGDALAGGEPIGKINRYALVGSNNYNDWFTIVSTQTREVNFNETVTLTFNPVQYRIYRLLILGVSSARDFIAIKNLTGGGVPFSSFENSLGESTIVMLPTTPRTLNITNFNSSYIGIQFNRVTSLTSGTVSLPTINVSTSIVSQTNLLPPQPMTSNSAILNVYALNTVGEGAEFIRVQTNSHPIRPVRYFLRSQIDPQWGYPISWILEASNDGINFEELDRKTKCIGTQNNATVLQRPANDNDRQAGFTITATNSYTIFRLTILEVLFTFTSQGRVAVTQFYVQDFQSSLVSVPNVFSLPMTTNITTGTVPRNQANTYTLAGSPVNTYNVTAGVVGEWIQLSAPVSFQPSKINFRTTQNLTYTLFASNDEQVWTRLINGGTMSGTGSANINTTSKFRYYRVIVTNINSPQAGQVSIDEIDIQDIVGERRNFIIPFCLKTNSLYHSGSLNFSMINSFELSDNIGTDKIYAVSHNILSFENGSADVIFR